MIDWLVGWLISLVLLFNCALLRQKYCSLLLPSPRARWLVFQRLAEQPQFSALRLLPLGSGPSGHGLWRPRKTYCLFSLLGLQVATPYRELGLGGQLSLEFVNLSMDSLLIKLPTINSLENNVKIIINTSWESPHSKVKHFQIDIFFQKVLDNSRHQPGSLYCASLASYPPKDSFSFSCSIFSPALEASEKLEQTLKWYLIELAPVSNRALVSSSTNSLDKCVSSSIFSSL